MDVYAEIDCEFYFERGRRYLFYAIRAKSGRDVFYHPQVCNLTRPSSIEARLRQQTANRSGWRS